MRRQAFANRIRYFCFFVGCLFLISCQQNTGPSRPVTRFDDPSPRQFCSRSGSNGPSGSPGIINGQPLAASSRIARGTVFIVTIQVSGGRLIESHCSGVLIGPRLVLTAAHCVPSSPGLTDSERGAGTKVFFTVDPTCDILQTPDSSRMRSSIRVKVHPNYDANEHINDLALVFLNRSAPSDARALPLIMDGRDPASNQDVFVAGFGRDTDFSQGSSSSPRLRYAVLYPSADPNPPVRAPGHPANDLLILDADRGSGVCSGDSGGPALMVDQGRLEVLGIASFVYDHEGRVATCLSRVAYSRLSAFRDWILATGRGWIRTL